MEGAEKRRSECDTDLLPAHLVCVVVDGLPSKVPHTVLQRMLLVLDGDVPLADVDAVSDHFIIGLVHGEPARPQRSHQAERETTLLAFMLTHNVCVCVCVCACVCACVHACVYAYACMCACMCVCIHVCVCVCACVRACVHVCVLGAGVMMGRRELWVGSNLYDGIS